MSYSKNDKAIIAFLIISILGMVTWAAFAQQPAFEASLTVPDGSPAGDAVFCVGSVDNCTDPLPLECDEGDCSVIVKFPQQVFTRLAVLDEEGNILDLSGPSNEVPMSLGGCNFVSDVCRADFNGNGPVAGLDYMKFKSLFGETCLENLPVLPETLEP